MEDSDFFEGVRAILVDKDNNPKWKYNSFRDFKHEDIVAKYFDRTEQIEINADEDVEK